VISRSTLPRPEREVRLTRQLFGSGVPYDLLVLTPEEMEERLRRNGPFIREILSTGRVVYQRHDAGHDIRVTSLAVKLRRSER
jgi:hypothetical protein